MGKSIRCKGKKRLRTAKRQRIDAMMVTPREEKHYAELCKQMQGHGVTLSTPKNAFRHPNAKDAIFPQKEIVKPIDFRSSHLPMAGYTFRGNRRKYSGEEKAYMENLAKTSHPKMEVMAGGGAVMSTGEKVTKEEAELIATSVRKPETYARIQAQPSAASAVAAAVEGDSAMDASSSAAPAAQEPEPADAADHSRRPIVKEVTRNKRVVENQTQRGTKSSKPKKFNPADMGNEKPQPVKKKALKKKDGDAKDADMKVDE